MTTGVAFGPGDLRRFAAAVLSTFSVPDRDAGLVAECLVDANLRGVDTHGIRLLPGYVDRIAAGVLEPRPNVRVVQHRPGVAVLDGGNGLGPVVGDRAVQEAVGIARELGVGVCVASRSNHLGALKWYVARMAAAGCIGLVTSNGSAAMAPHGGRAPFFGANPLGYAVPATGTDIVFDMATSVASRARIRQRGEQGLGIPEGWAVAPSGAPAVDAAEAIAGAVLPMAGPKGYGLALLLDVLSAGLSGAGFSHENADLYSELGRPQGLGHFVLAIDPSAGAPGFGDRIDDLVGALSAAPPATGVARVRVPGDRDAQRSHDAEEGGITLADELVDRLQSLGAQRGVPFRPME